MGLQLCALELTDQQLDTLAFLALTGLLPEFFPCERWVLAVRKSFLSREIVVCYTRGQWEEVREILQSVRTADEILKSKNGATLWTKASASLPIPLDDEFPLRVLVPPLNRDQAHMSEVVHIEATGLGGKDIGLPENMSIRTDPEGQNVYGPSLATVEDVVVEPCGSGGQSTKHVTALGLLRQHMNF